MRAFLVRLLDADYARFHLLVSTRQVGEPGFSKAEASRQAHNDWCDKEEARQEELKVGQKPTT